MVVTPIENADPLAKPAVGLEIRVGVTLAVQLSETVGAVQVTTAVVPVVV